MNIENLFGKGYYEIKTKCENCGKVQMTKINKGNKPEDVIHRGKCENCGCNTLELVKTK